MIYDLTVSGIDGNGHQCISGMLEPERLDNHGLRIGKAFSFELFHPKNRTEFWTFGWINGAPRNWKQIATFRDEIIAENEVEKILKEYGLLEVEVSE